MSKHIVPLTKVFLVHRRIKLEVEADDIESARELVENGAVDLPEWSDERWQEDWALQYEDD